MRKKGRKVLHILKNIIDGNFCISHDEYSYNILLPYVSTGYYYDVWCHINILPDNIYLYAFADGDFDTIHILFDLNNLKAYKIRWIPPDLDVEDFEIHLIGGKSYFSFRIPETADNVFTYVVKVPDMKLVKVKGRYSVCSDPRFIIFHDDVFHDEDPLGNFFIDTVDDSIWYHPLKKKAHIRASDSIVHCTPLDFWIWITESLNVVDAAYNILYTVLYKTRENRIMVDKNHLTPSATTDRLFDYRIINKHKGFRELVKLFLERRMECKLSWELPLSDTRITDHMEYHSIKLW